MNNDYLKHEGILGMHWGDRNGPPYPLQLNQMTAAQKKANSNKSWFKDKVQSAKRKKREKEDEKQAHKEGRLSDKERSDVFNKADVKTAYEHVSEFSNKDIEFLLRRYDIKKQLSEKVSDIEYKSKMKNQRKIERASKYVGTAANLGRKLADVYNVAAGVANAFGDKNWKPIRIGEYPKQQKDRNKDKGNETSLDEDKKNEIFKNADIKEAYKYKSELSNNDLKNIMNRYDTYQNLSKKIDRINNYSDIKEKEKKNKGKSLFGFLDDDDNDVTYDSDSSSYNIKMSPKFSISSNTTKSKANKGSDWFKSSKQKSSNRVASDYSRYNLSDIDYVNNGTQWMQNNGWIIDYSREDYTKYR